MLPRSRPASTVYWSASADVAAPPGQLGELREHVVKEERQPDAFAFAVLADQVHAVIPVAAAHQRQAVVAEAQAVVDGADAMLVERADVVGNLRQVVVRFLVRTQRPRTSGTARVRRARRCRRSCRHSGRWHRAATGNHRRSACARRGPTGGCHQCCTSPSRNWRAAARSRCSRSKPRLGMHEGHRVLQLVAEAERAARLIESGARPHAAGERLVDEPAVGQEVDGRVGRFDIDHAERPAPVVPHAFQRPMGAVDAAEPLHELPRLRLRCRRRRAMKTMSFSCPSSSVERDLHGGARIESRADAAGESHAAQRRGVRRRAVAAEELGAVAGDRSVRFAAVDKDDAVGELGAVGVAREKRAADRVQLRSPRASATCPRSSPSTNSQ